MTIYWTPRLFGISSIPQHGVQPHCSLPSPRQSRSIICAFKDSEVESIATQSHTARLRRLLDGPGILQACLAVQPAKVIALTMWRGDLDPVVIERSKFRDLSFTILAGPLLPRWPECPADRAGRLSNCLHERIWSVCRTSWRARHEPSVLY